MKKFSHFLVIGLCAIAAFTSCKKEDNGPAPLPVEQIVGEYGTTPQKTFALNYSGKPMFGKTVTVEATNNETAKLIIKGANPMAQKAGLPGLSFPGVIAGEKETVLNVNLVNVDGIAYSFEGEDKNDLRTIQYKGTMDPKGMTLELTVTMANTFANANWKLQSYEADPFTPEEPKSTPLYFNWVSTEKLHLLNQVPGIPFPLPMQVEPNKFLATFLCQFGVAGSLTASEALGHVLNEVHFHADGNVTASYSTKENIEKPVWNESEINVAQYYIKGDKLFLVLNPMGLLAGTKAGEQAPSFNIQPALGGLMGLMPLLSDGIAFSIKETENGGMRLFLDTEFNVKLFSSILLPLLKDSQNQALITAKAAGILNSVFGEGADKQFDIAKTTESLEKVLKTTSNFELGLNLIK